jgi:hypothetical protein
MTKNEREKLRKALDCLEMNPCEWEDAMAILYPLAGFNYFDLREVKGDSVNVIEASAKAVAKVPNVK